MAAGHAAIDEHVVPRLTAAVSTQSLEQRVSDLMAVTHEAAAELRVQRRVLRVLAARLGLSLPELMRRLTALEATSAGDGSA
jgi:hypothetical protein